MESKREEHSVEGTQKFLVGYHSNLFVPVKIYIIHDIPKEFEEDEISGLAVVFLEQWIDGLPPICPRFGFLLIDEFLQESQKTQCFTVSWNYGVRNKGCVHFESLSRPSPPLFCHLCPPSVPGSCFPRFRFEDHRVPGSQFCQRVDLEFSDTPGARFSALLLRNGARSK